jgi:hypothetical protein
MYSKITQKNPFVNTFLKNIFRPIAYLVDKLYLKWYNNSVRLNKAFYA